VRTTNLGSERLMTMRSQSFAGVVTAGLIAGAIALAPSDARAEGPVDPTGKGIVGGALLGAEVVLITTAIIGPKTWWPYVVFGAVGAGGGAVGGYFVEQVDDGQLAEPSLYMLAGGMALVIPTVVAILNATAYEPEEDEEELEGSESDGTPEEGTDTEGRNKRRMLPMAFVGVDMFGGAERTAELSLGIPAVVVKSAYTDVEVSQYGVEQGTEVHVPVVVGSF
jgi:hypothetical protein